MGPFLVRAFLAWVLAPCAFTPGLAAQEEDVRGYVAETDPLARERLERWQDLKLGLLLHWGPYAQWGIVESWSLCSEDEEWCRRPPDSEYGAYKREYEALQTTFDPVGFDPDRWAEAARDAGMRYVVFTTKHHDGFTMYDTRETDYRITSPRTPFSSDPRADVTRRVFDAFRGRDLWIGAYFSKPDWHHPDYWWPYFATPDRYPNYDVGAHPDRWARFVAFTHAQIRELMSGYGAIDILWLDGGWVRTHTEEELAAIRARPGFPKQRVQSLDIDMPRLVRDARALQPGLIVVDRAVPGPYQNYLTPEARIPAEPVLDPWEVPMPMATSWSYVPDDPYKSARELVHMLVEVVSRGGNLLLNVGPGPDGALHEAAYDRMAALGAWMRVNSEAIYGTRAVAPYGSGDVRLTRGADGSVYAIVLAGPDARELPAALIVPGIRPARGAAVTLVGPGTPLAWEESTDGMRVRFPTGTRMPSEHAWALRVSAVAR
jgi:alpha-L-fucosidase